MYEGLVKMARSNTVRAASRVPATLEASVARKITSSSVIEGIAEDDEDDPSAEARAQAYFAQNVGSE